VQQKCDELSHTKFGIDMCYVTEETVPSITSIVTIIVIITNYYYYYYHHRHHHHHYQNYHHYYPDISML